MANNEKAPAASGVTAATKPSPSKSAGNVSIHKQRTNVHSHDIYIFRTTEMFVFIIKTEDNFSLDLKVNGKYTHRRYDITCYISKFI